MSGAREYLSTLVALVAARSFRFATYLMRSGPPVWWRYALVWLLGKCIAEPLRDVAFWIALRGEP